jgi:hypothetical protein
LNVCEEEEEEEEEKEVTAIYLAESNSYSSSHHLNKLQGSMISASGSA